MAEEIFDLREAQHDDIGVALIEILVERQVLGRD
jgi:hypothetical protein